MSDHQFFPTPIDAARIAVKIADIQPCHSVLEPSAGTGALLRQIMLLGPRRLVAVDVDPERYIGLSRQFKPKPGDGLLCCDFLLLRWGEKDKFDRVLMNPPFNPARDVTHVLHAYDHALKKGGLLTAIITPRFKTSRSKEAARLRELVFYARGANGVRVLPQNHDPGATVDTVLIQLRRPK